MTLLKCGFDTTIFADALTWIKVHEGCKLYGYKELDDEKGFLWTGQHIKVLTSDDPMTGLSRIKALNHAANVRHGYAGYIGIEGEAQAVLEFVGMVFLNAEFVKGFDAQRSSFITMP